MINCECGREFSTQKSLNSHARFCNLYEKKVKNIRTEYTCECGREFESGQSLNAHFSRCLVHRNGKPTRKFKFYLNDESRKKSGDTYSKRISLGELIPGFKNKSHSVKTRQLLSDKMSERNNGYVKTKYHEIFCPLLKTTVKVQGSWELKFATILNDNNILWEKGFKYPIKYFHNNIFHKYLPDFFLTNYNVYVEIKGFWFKSKDGRVDDKRKMKLVAEQNPDIQIIILDSLAKIEKFNVGPKGP